MKEFFWRLRRSFSLLRLYWGTEDCDWTVITELMAFQIRRIRLHVIKHNHVMKADRIAKEMLIAETLLHRIQGDEVYFDNASARSEFFRGYQLHNSEWAQQIKQLDEYDVDYLCTILKKHLKSWWD